ncbi:hypothetical protein TNCT_204601 [Trichonephila clavata]|uniref:Uncharacterized protein n=1 Tax=Trichonephila clavata TaxID=2740835 RepID=A0A8X6JQ05_TRICU|nr:hypothetical protein TNCT_204601 [Trichonephila clavata]
MSNYIRLMGELGATAPLPLLTPFNFNGTVWNGQAQLTDGWASRDTPFLMALEGVEMSRFDCFAQVVLCGELLAPVWRAWLSAVYICHLTGFPYECWCY